MAARALAAAAAAAVGGGRRMVSAGRTGPAPLLASCRSGAKNQYCSASGQPEEDVNGAAMTGAQVQAALNRKNVEVLPGEDERVATENTLGAGVLLEGEDASAWVPDQETGVFGPADADSSAPTHGGGGSAPPSATTSFTGGSSSSSVLDQTVFVREDDMEDVERPAMANTDAGSSNN